MTVGARLKWRPARLRVKSNIDAGVAVGGKPLGRTNRVFSVPIKGTPEQRVKILVSAKGYRPEARQVTIGAGEEDEVTVNLAAEDSVIQ